MEKNAKTYIAGHKGLVGSAIWKTLERRGYTNLIGRSHLELNLLDACAVEDFFETEKPEYVFLAAAKVGGIIANNTYRGQFIYENLMIQNNIIHQSYLNGVKKLLFLGSSCIYPKNSPQPMREEYLLTDTLEYTNEPYALAKIAGIKMCESYNLQYGTNYLSVMPTNLYGPNDNYDLEKSHVLPALIRKMHLGKCLQNNDWAAIDADLNKRPVEGITGKFTGNEKTNILEKYGVVRNGDSVSIHLWGTGLPRREFLYSEDMADACVHIMERCNFMDFVGSTKDVTNTHVNIGTGEDLTIKELAGMVKSAVGFAGKLEWDSTKPDGTRQKLLNVDKLSSLGWKARVTLDEGIAQVYKTYVA